MVGLGRLVKQPERLDATFYSHTKILNGANLRTNTSSSLGSCQKIMIKICDAKELDWSPSMTPQDLSLHELPVEPQAQPDGCDFRFYVAPPSRRTWHIWRPDSSVLLFPWDNLLFLSHQLLNNRDFWRLLLDNWGTLGIAEVPTQNLKAPFHKCLPDRTALDPNSRRICCREGSPHSISWLRCLHL